METILKAIAVITFSANFICIILLIWTKEKETEKMILNMYFTFSVIGIAAIFALIFLTASLH